MLIWQGRNTPHSSCKLCPTPRSVLGVRWVAVVGRYTLFSRLMELAASEVALAKRQIESIFHVMVLALGGKKIIDLMEFLNSYIFYLGPVQPGPGLFVHGTTAFCPLIPAETLLVEAECRQIKALLGWGQCICSSNACWVSESFFCQKEAAAWKGLSYYLQKMEGTYLLMRDISWSKEQGNSLWVNTSCL